MTASKWLAICGLEGPLVDTHGVHFKAYKTALNLKGYSLDRAYYDAHSNLKWQSFLSGCMATDDPSALRQVYESKLGFFKTFIEDGRLNDILVNQLQSLKERFRLGLLTTASRPTVDEILECFALDDLFDYMITGEDMLVMSSSTESFQKFTTYFDVPKDNVVFYETSEESLQSARRYGIQCHNVMWSAHD